MKAIILLTMLLTISLQSFATQTSQEENIVLGRESHGGDSIAFDFITAAREGILALRRHRSTLPNDLINYSLLEHIIKKVEIQTTTDSVYVNRDNNDQQSTALNYIDRTGKMIIRIDRILWRQIISQQSKSALALHEVLCLAGYEKTYDYSYSFAALISKTPTSDIERSGILYCNDSFESGIFAKKLNGFWTDSSVDFKLQFTYVNNNLHFVKTIGNRTSTLGPARKCYVNNDFNHTVLKLGDEYFQYKIDGDTLELNVFEAIDTGVFHPFKLKRAKLVVK